MFLFFLSLRHTVDWHLRHFALNTWMVARRSSVILSWLLCILNARIGAVWKVLSCCAWLLFLTFTVGAFCAYSIFFLNLTLLLWLEHWPSLHRLQLASLLVASFSFLQPAVEAHLLPSLTCLFCIHLWLFSFGHQFPFLFISHFISSLLLSRRFLSHASGLFPRNFAWSVLKLRCARFRLWISDCDRLSFFHGVLVAYRDIAGEEVPGKLHLCRDLYLPLLRQTDTFLLVILLFDLWMSCSKTSYLFFTLSL